MNNILIPRNLDNRNEIAKKIWGSKIRDYLSKKGINLDLFQYPLPKLAVDIRRIEGNLSLDLSEILYLPDDLYVGGCLDLYCCPIKTLPSGLHVGGNLNLSATKVDDIPDKIYVGGNVYLRGCPLVYKYKLKEIKEIILDRGGYVEGNLYKNKSARIN